MHSTLRRFLLGIVALVTLGLPLPRVYAAGTVGTGTPASCTAAALVSAVSGGGLVAFNCGSSPVTITLTAPLDISAVATTIDGGGLVTLSGAGVRRIILHRSLSTSSTLTLRNLTLADGAATGNGTAANGAAIQSIFQGAQPSFKPTLIIENVIFTANRSNQTGTAGNAYDFGGGAIYSQGGTVTISGSTFINNRADNGAGGAIHILQSALSIIQSSFTNNSAIGTGQGGAIYIDGLGGASGTFQVSQSSFSSNTSHNSGGAIYLNMYENSTSATIDRTSFTNNAIIGGSGALGGAISGGGTNIGGNSGNPSITITNSTFAGNSVRRSNAPFDGSGGALAFAQRARISIGNSTFSGNRAEGTSFNANGGALYVVNNTDQFLLNNNTFVSNSAGWVGGAISNSQISGGPGGVVRNTIFANNTADNGPNDWNIQQHCSSELSDDGSNLQYPGRLTGANFFNDVTCFAGKSAPEQTSLPAFRDPKLLMLADTGGPTQTAAIAYDSPARDTGNAATCTSTDQRNSARNGPCDIGAHEFASVSYLRVLAPPYAEAGQPGVTLMALGADLDPGSSVLWNGTPLNTSFVNSGQLQASVPAPHLAMVGDANITLRNGTNAVSLNARTFRILAQVYDIALPRIGR